MKVADFTMQYPDSLLTAVIRHINKDITPFNEAEIEIEIEKVVGSARTVPEPITSCLTGNLDGALIKCKRNTRLGTQLLTTKNDLVDHNRRS